MLELFRHEFVQNAFLAGTIVAIVAAVIGYFAVLRAQAFATHALSHIGFAGATGAVLLGMSSLVGMFAFTLVAAMGMGALGERVRGRDVEVGMVLSFALGLGVLFISLYTQYATETVGVLFGSILTVTRNDVLITLG
jgi:zinc/manganese transport system permease protein